MKKIQLFLLILVFASLSFVSCDDESESTKTLEEKMEGVWEWVEREEESGVVIPGDPDSGFDSYGKFEKYQNGVKKLYWFNFEDNTLTYCPYDNQNYTIDEDKKTCRFVNSDGDDFIANVSFEGDYMFHDYSENYDVKWKVKMKKVDPSVIDAAYEYCD